MSKPGKAAPDSSPETNSTGWLMRRPRLAATALGIVCVGISIVALEWALGFVVSDQPRIVVEEEGLIEYVPDVHHVLNPNVQVDATAHYLGKLDYRATYTTDQFGRRAIPRTEPVTGDEFLIVLGCSFAFGMGCNDDETLPYYLSQHTAKYNVYNYGVGAYGPANVLLALQQRTLETEIAEKKGIVLYVFIQDQIRRTICSMSRAWAWDYPYFELENGLPVYRGEFDDVKPRTVAWYRWLSKRNLVRSLNLDLPPVFTDRHYETTAALITESIKHIQEIFPDTRAYTLIYQYDHEFDTGQKLRRLLEPRGIPCFDYTPTIYAEPDLYWFKDGHPTPQCHRLVAELLARDLGLSPSA